MPSITIDIVATLPPETRALALLVSQELNRRMRQRGQRSRFQLGQPFPGSGEPGTCEPHVSLFMLRIDRDDVDKALASVVAATVGLPAVSAIGEVYRHNPYGAPELFYRATPQWVTLQRRIVDQIEPLRHGELRELDPAGVNLVDLVERLDRKRDECDPAQLRQLLAYGYDEITDDLDDRFRPHVTLAWPSDSRHRVDLRGLPPASEFSCALTTLAVFGMCENGTCTRWYGEVALSGIPRENCP